MTACAAWLVIIALEAQGHDAESVCTIGGTLASPVHEMANAQIGRLSEEQIQKIVDGTFELGGDE